MIVPRSRAFTIGGRMDAQEAEVTAFDTDGVARLVAALREAGAEAVAICLLDAYANSAHELKLRETLAVEMSELVISLSHEVSPEAREFDRLCTTIANAYIQPLMERYLVDFAGLCAADGLTCPILMMTAGDGMTTVETAARLPIRLVESGPAGDAILAARIVQDTGETEVLSFDMGGTTAKLCLSDAYRPQMVRKLEMSRAARFIKGSGRPVCIPVIEMIEIGVGSGSITSVDSLGRVQVGPHSAGANPGPAAFGKGGADPTVTDADVAQGLIDPARFAEGRLQIDRAATETALDRGVGRTLTVTPVQAAVGVGEIVDESMASAGRMHAVERARTCPRR